ncbi:hypothetical protein ACTZWW_12355 [Salinarimonas sp. NSM]|uniref:hypothetical protein n=1 Tax=Salinarimonas sp. NSM TaxID=3458003 RepID=UPI0040367C20
MPLWQRLLLCGLSPAIVLAPLALGAGRSAEALRDPPVVSRSATPHDLARSWPDLPAEQRVASPLAAPAAHPLVPARAVVTAQR